MAPNLLGVLLTLLLELEAGPALLLLIHTLLLFLLFDRGKLKRILKR